MPEEEGENPRTRVLMHWGMCALGHECIGWVWGYEWVHSCCVPELSLPVLWS